MQTKSFPRLGAAIALAGCMLGLHQARTQPLNQSAPGISAVAAPVIVTPPSDQAADYGANASFSVGATGNGLRYRWRKDGLELGDYGNVSGARTSTLKLVGVAQVDAARYSVVISGTGGSITSAPARLTIKSTTIFASDFESDGGKWRPFSDKNALSISTLQNHTPGGKRSAALSTSQERMYHNLGAELVGAAKATFWIYDDNGTQERSYGEMRGYTGPGHGRYAPPGGLRQLFAIGRYTVPFSSNQKGLLAEEAVDPWKYQGRVDRGKNTGWFNLDTAPNRSRGWHKFEIERDADGTTIRFYVDGVLGRTIADADHVPIDCIAIGSSGVGTTAGAAWFDDVKVESFPWRYDWHRKDSDGKGLPDWVKLRETGTDPVVTDIRQITTLAEAPGHAISKMVGRWESDQHALYSLDMRGYVEYVVTAPAHDAYRIEIEGRERNGKSPTISLPLIVSVDGEHLGRFILPYTGTTNGFVHCLTPFLQAGPHTIRIYWDNVQSHCSLYLRAIRLQTLLGPDQNGNGIKDWVENRLLMQSGLESAPVASATSPVCIEGRGQYLSMQECAAGPSLAEMVEIPVEAAGTHQWFANVPLSPDRPTRVELSYQNGGLQEGADVVWKVTNLLEADDVTVRKGDALLVTAVPGDDAVGEVNIDAQGLGSYATDTLTPMPLQFDRPGIFTVTGTFVPTGAQRSIRVKVVEAALDGPVAAWVAKKRYWNCTNLPAEAVLDMDPRLKSAQTPLGQRWGPNAREVGLTHDAAETRYALARLGKNGPVLDAIAVQGFRLFNCYDTYLRLIETYPDQSQLIEEAFVLSPVLPNVTVSLQIIVSGVTFEDGTVTRMLGPADFDELGVCRVRYVRAAGVQTSVCHTTKAYQGDTVIGWPAYEK